MPLGTPLVEAREQLNWLAKEILNWLAKEIMSVCRNVEVAAAAE
jgi:hypothetical protein